MRVYLVSFIIIFTILMPIKYVKAHDFYVSTETGNDSNTGDSWGNALQTISQAILRCSTGDRILVAEGVYFEKVNLMPELQLLGSFSVPANEQDLDAHPSIINGENSRRCVIGASDCLLDSFILDHGQGDSGGGILHNNISMTVRNCIVRNCVSIRGNPSGGGGMYFLNSNSQINECLFHSNTASYDSEHPSGEIMGGGIHMWSSAPTFNGCTFRNNTAIDPEEQRIELGGGGWAVASYPRFFQCVFEDNSATFGGGFGWWNHSEPLFEDCTFTSNSALKSGGGICAIYSEFDFPIGVTQIADSKFTQNTASFGSAIAMLRHAKILLINCLLTNNLALDKGSVHCEGSVTTQIINCTMVSNLCMGTESDIASGIQIDDSSTAFLKNNIIASNTGGAGIAMDGIDPLRIWIEGSDFFNNQPKDYSNSIVSRTGLAGNISENPRFVIQGDHSFYLSEPDTGNSEQEQIGRSPCIDSGLGSVHLSRLSQRIARTDQILDYGMPDMGYHLPPDMPFLAWVSPRRMATEILVNTQIKAIIADLYGLIDPTSIDLNISNTNLHLSVEPCIGGYSIIATPETNFELCEEVIVQVDAARINGPMMKNGEFNFYTESCSPTPTMTPTLPNECNPPECSITGKLEYTAGDNLVISWTAYNGCLLEQEIDAYFVLEYCGEYFIYPEWNDQIIATSIKLKPGEEAQLDIMNFQLPELLDPAGPFFIFGIITEKSTMTLLSEPEKITIWFV